MDAKTKQEISGALESYIARKQLSQKTAAEQIGINVATVNNIIRRKYESSDNLISDEMWRKVQNFLRDDMPSGGWKIVTTRNFSAIQELCRETQENPRMVAVTGISGGGKTTALRHYASKTPNCYYILCDCLMTQKSFLKAVAKSLGLPSGGTKEDILADITDRLNEDNCLLILDDLGKVQDRVYRMLQLIYDRTEGRAGIVLSGVNFLKKYIADMAERDKMGFRELKRRIEYWLPVAEPKKEEITAVCQNNGIVDPAAIGEVQRVARDFGTLRAIVFNARQRGTGTAITADVIRHLKIGA